jgi:TonB family protein
MTRKLQTFFWLAVLLHLLLFLSITVQLVWFPSKDYSEKSDGEKAMPAYIYHEDHPRPTPAVMPNNASPPPENPPQPEVIKKEEVSVNGILKAQPEAKPEVSHEKQSKSYSYSVPAGSVNLKSDKQVDQPLLRILSIATAAKLFYPKAAQDFRVEGTAVIRFLISPDGRLSDINLVSSTGAGVLDQAALQTMNAISPVKGVELYLKEPRYLVVNLIYG